LQRQSFLRLTKFVAHRHAWTDNKNCRLYFLSIVCKKGEPHVEREHQDADLVSALGLSPMHTNTH
jgi:hypothetical protein